MNKRVVILWLCLFVRAVSLMAQDVPAGVVTAFKKGDSQELNGHLSDKVELFWRIVQSMSTAGRQRERWPLSFPAIR